ncbi:cilia- and flagella-associated protein 43 [Anableps anableps]
MNQPAISELSEKNPFSYESLLSTRATLTPSAVCWAATSQLYVGCVEGYLLVVDIENLSVSVLFNPAADDAILELKNFYFQALTLSSNGLIAVGKEGVVHCLQIRRTQTSITQTWQLDRPVSAAMVSPDNGTLLLSANTGQIYLLNPGNSDQIEKVLDVLSGSFLTAALLHTDKNICVSLREGGVLELWSSNGSSLGSLPLQTEVTSLACCPIAHYAAVGTASGKVLFIDLNSETQLRLVHEVYLYHSAVAHLVFDQEGHYLLCSGSDLHLYVLDARPSTMFSVIGFIDVPDCVLSLSTQCLSSSEKVNVLVLCASQEDEKNDGSLLMVFSLPLKNIAGPDCVDRNGCLYIVEVFRYIVPIPLTSCALGVNEVFAYCHRQKTLQRFQLPKGTGGLSSQQVVQLNLKEEVKGHLLGPVSLLLSPDCMWLASIGRDGSLRIRSTSSVEDYCELWCHSCCLGGIRTVSFSQDGQTLVTTGFKDGSLLCINFRAVDAYDKKGKRFSQYRQAMSMETAFNSENPILITLPEWDQETPVSCKKTEETEVSSATSIDVTEQDESYLPIASSPTWFESRQEEIVKEDNKQYTETKKNLRETIKELRETIQKMLRENESLPEEQFNLNVEEQKRLDTMVEQEAERVRAEIEQEIIEKCYLRDVMKRERWDSMMIKPRTIRAFHSEMAVKNYPLKERTEKELEEIRRVHNMRKIEKAACKLRDLKKNSSEQEEEQDEEGHEAENTALNGSISAQLGYTSPCIYNQFSLQTVEQRINQIILFQDLIYSIKMAFNSDFEALLKRKLQELKRLQDRNKNIREVMQKLNVKQTLWEPSLTDNEWPERVLIVDDSEIKAEKYLTPEQREQEERERLEKESRLTAQSDDSRERALDDMMEGVLEVKKIDILKVEIPPPEFVVTKADIQWSEEEKKTYKEYEKNVKDLNEEKEKYKRGLEIEIKKLQESIKDATEKFDESLTKLFEKKLTSTLAIYQEELKITYLADSVHTVDEMNNQEQDLKLKLEQLLANKMKTEKDLMRYEDEVEQFQYLYENVVADDKLLDNEFRKGFADQPKHVTDQLYKLFKRRPRVQRLRAQTEHASNLFKQHGPNSFQAPDGLSQMLTAMAEMDAPENMPKGLSPFIWEKFCVVRKAKVESEHRMKMKALNLAEMQAFLHRRSDEDNACLEEIELHFEALQSLRSKRNQHLMNTTVQVVLPQGQVETSTADWTAETAETDFIVLHKSVIDNLKDNIRRLAEQNIASMEARREVRKDIIQLEWEHRVMNKKIEDLNDKKKDMKMLRLSKEDMKCLGKKDQNAYMLEKIIMLEKSIAFMKQTHKRSIHQRMKKLKRINKKMAKIEQSTADFEKELPYLQVTVSELRHIYEAADTEENEAKEREERYQEIIHRRDLADLARAQSEELDILWNEVERLERRNFPSLDQMKYN